MKFQELKNFTSLQVDSKPKTKGIILITDNRSKLFPQNSKTIDFRQSAFKQTQIDPLSAWTEPNIVQQEQILIYQLNMRLQKLQQRMQKLQKYEQTHQISKKQSQNQKKVRRKFNQIDRKYKCQIKQCQRVYGSQTSLRHHLKLKHSIIEKNQTENQGVQKVQEEQKLCKDKKGMSQQISL